AAAGLVSAGRTAQSSRPQSCDGDAGAAARRSRTGQDAGRRAARTEFRAPSLRRCAAAVRRRQLDLRRCGRGAERRQPAAPLRPPDAHFAGQWRTLVYPGMTMEKSAVSDTGNTEKAARHAARMARKKAVIDKHIAEADIERGVFVIHTGNGKGKSSSAFGVVARALGHGQKVAVVQFIKGRSDTGEEAFFRAQPNVQWHVGGEGFTWDTQDDARDAKAAQTA